MYRFVFHRFLVTTYFYGVILVLGKDNNSSVSIVRFPNAPDGKELNLSFLNRASRTQNPPGDFICDDSTMEDRINYCGAVIMVLRKFTPEQLKDQQPVSDYYEQYHFDCHKKHVVYEYLDKGTLENVPMFFCSKFFIYFRASESYGITTDFYIRQGRSPDQLLVFIDLPYSRKSKSFDKPLKNSVKLWHVVTFSTPDEKSVVVDESKASIKYERQLSSELLGINIGERLGDSGKEEDVKLKKQLSRQLSRQRSIRLSRQLSAQLSITHRRHSNQSSPRSPPQSPQGEDFGEMIEDNKKSV